VRCAEIVDCPAENPERNSDFSKTAKK